MSQAHFFRVKVIEAVRDSLNDIYNARDTKLQEAKAELAALDKKMADRTWWKKITANYDFYYQTSVGYEKFNDYKSSFSYRPDKGVVK